MRVLVTGATGFVGRHVVACLLADGHTVTAVARDEAKARSLAWGDRVDLVSADVHRDPVADMLRPGEPDVVMHLAWPGLPRYKDMSHLHENLFADYRCMRALLDAGVKHVLVTGTCFEYGLQEGCLSEDRPTHPVTPYAVAKDTLRRLLEVLTGGAGVTLQWARLFYIYGPGQHPQSLLSQLDRAVDGGEEVFNMSGGEQLRDYLPVEGVAARLVRLAGHPRCAGIVNVCRGEPMSVRRLVEDHLARRGATIRLNLGHYPYPDHEPMAFWGDPRKYRSFVGSD